MSDHLWVGITTTKPVIGADQPFGRFTTAHVDHRRAEALRQGGATIQIDLEDDLRLRLSRASA